MDQDSALAILKTGRNVYLTGSAGTGKTYLLNRYIEYLRVREIPLAITASTGIAATHVGGQTIHSWSGIGIREEITPSDLERIGKNSQTSSRIKKVQVLIIDEISMLSGKVLTGISQIISHFKKNKAPFGGIQVILSGDFFQLPPVSKTFVSNREKFAFMSPIWVHAQLNICYLQTQFRQGTDTLSIILSEIRTQDVTDDSIDRLREKLQEETNDPTAVKLYTHNADVDSMNEAKLKENSHPLKTFYAETKGQSKLLEGLRQSVLAIPELHLKQEAKVMFVKNNPEKGYYNGTIGTVTEFDPEEGYPIIELLNGRKIIARPEEWTVSDEKELILASYKQIPVRLAWAITVHKSQGMTLESAEINLSKTFEPGQGYVALSRLTHWDGLALTGINQVSLELDGLAVKADKRFKELSEESEDWLNERTEDELEVAFRDFVIKSGGTNDPETIASNEHREKQYYQKTKKESTYVKTLELIKAGKQIEEIAFERELSLGTIVNHLEQLLEIHPDLNIERFAPEKRDLERVSKAIEKIKNQGQEEFLDKDGRVKLGFIHRAIGGKLDYETIRLARLFVGSK